MTVAVLLSAGSHAWRRTVSKRLLVEPERSWAWTSFFTADPRGQILDSADPAARWLLLTGVLDRADDDDEVLAAHRGVLADPLTRDLIDRLPEPERPPGLLDVTTLSSSKGGTGVAAPPSPAATRGYC